MYRNVYLQCYKSATNQQQNLEFLICHFNHAYVALGSILNDIEYAVGKLLAAPRSNGSSLAHQQQQQERVKERLGERSRKSIDAIEAIPVRQSLEKISKPAEPPKELHRQLNPTQEFDEMFNLSKPPVTPNGMGAVSSSAKKDSPAIGKPTKVDKAPRPGSSGGDDILDQLFGNR